MRKRNVLVGLIATGVLVIGAVVGVAAQTPGAGASGGGNFLTKLAANLGIGEDQLKAAVDQAQAKMIDEAVAAGKITQAQADQMKQRLAEGGKGFGFPGEGRHGGPRGPMGTGMGLGVDVYGEVVGLLGMQPQDLMQALRAGKSLAQIAQEHSVSVDTLKPGLTALAKAHLDQAVADGKLTAEQASTMLTKLSEQIDNILNGQLGPRGPRGARPEHKGPPVATSSAAPVV
ncbi:MAG: hypothetical protein EXR43_05210 [Dehalococcoidia bacterium]|nr:hypothetical protein [Dehalococcoidia bacterium]